MASPWTAVPAGADPRALARSISAAHDDFLASGHADAGVRTLVSQSWERALRAGLDPEHGLAPLDLAGADLHAHRAEHPLARVMPVIRRLLVEDATDSGLLVAISDAAGRLLWVEGDPALRSRAESMHFAPGANWSEADAGTNAPGTALVLDHAVSIFGAEHLARPVTPWSCAAAPIHDPDTGAVLGALDLTGGDAVASPYALSLVRTAVHAVESELRLLGLAAPAPHARLEVLGRHAGLLRHAAGETRLSLRHTELLVLLAARPEGRSAEELAMELHDGDTAPVTVRAEMSRLRRLLHELRLDSRPYRLPDPLLSDAADVDTALLAGRVHRAVELYKGPLLPHSEAPGVARLREDLHRRLRTALVRHGDPDALLRFADTVHSSLDLEIWQAALRALPVASPRRPEIYARVKRIAAELATR